MVSTWISYTKSGATPSETKHLWVQRNHILKPDKKRIVGKDKDSERIQEYRPSQTGRKRIFELNIEIYNCFFHYCETLGSTHLPEFQQNNYESWINNNQSDGESRASRTKQDKCPTNTLKKLRKHETVNLIRLTLTAKINTLDPNQNEGTTETIKRAGKDFSLDLPLLVDETAQDGKILNAISAIEKDQLESIFYPYRPHRLHLSTRFRLLFYNNKIVIPENLRTTIIAMLHQGHTSTAKMDQLAEAFCLPGIHRETQQKAETCPSCRAAGESIKTQIPSTVKSRLEILTEPNQEIQLDFAGPIKSNTRGYVKILAAIDRFSKWPTAQIRIIAETPTVLKFLTS